MGAFDASRDLVVLHGGWFRISNTAVYFPNNTLTFGRTEPPTFYDLVAAQPANRPADTNGLMIHDPATDRVLMLNGMAKVTDTSGYPASADKFGLWSLSLDFAVPTRLDFAEATVEGDIIRVRFVGEGASGDVTVERSEGAAAEAWEARGPAEEVTPAVYEYLDRAAMPGRGYRYRARFWDGQVERVTAASALVTRPEVAGRLALRLADGAAGRGWPAELEVSAPAPGSPRIELIDVAGRIVARRTIAVSPERMTRVSLAPRRPAAGLYFARVVQVGQAVTLRVVRW
jgi:hypothetical protein